jgi:DNA replication factor Dna2
MRHALFEEAMKDQNFSVEAAIEYTHNIINRHAEALLSCNVSSSEAESEILRFLPQLQFFASTYTEFGQTTAPCNSAGALLESHASSRPLKFVAKSVHAVEEPIVSAELGFKGYADMLVNALTASADVNHFSERPAASIMGIELKTGHNQNTQHAHVAQLALYVLMLQAAYGNAKISHHEPAAESGMLLYMSNEAVRAVHVAPTLAEIKSLVSMRNVVAIASVRSSRPRGVQLSYEADSADPSKHVAK